MTSRTQSGGEPVSSSVVERKRYALRHASSYRHESPFRHVATTGLIRDLVITEEGGIAKGIRRIIAVTGDEAEEVTRTADALAARLAHANRLTGGEKDNALKEMSVVGQARIGLASQR